MNTFVKILLFSLAVLVLSCGRRQQEAEKPLSPVTRSFPSLTPPSMLQEQSEIAEWMAFHYWDVLADGSEGYSCDSAYVSGIAKAEMEQAMANFIYILDMLPIETAIEASGKLADRMHACEEADTASNVLEMLSSISERYMYDPNSPLRNEDYFQPVASMLSQSHFLDKALRGKFARISSKSKLNRVGTRAADFSFCDRGGRSYSLYEIEAEYTLLFFSNPGCGSCLEIINNLKSSEKISRMISEGRLAVLNIYIDEDLQAWRDYMSIYPKDWYNGFDPELVLRNNDIYYVRAIPSLYLLDESKMVILKDADPEKLFMTIQNI